MIRFLRDLRTRATVMAVGGIALTCDHNWLVDQRDVLKTAATATVAATLELQRTERTPGDSDLKAKLLTVAERCVSTISHVCRRTGSIGRSATVGVKVFPNRRQGTVE
ncbi:MAG: hypothetical protein OXC14_10305 [Rhodospirillaceae bacterium]|nr:hypothetical protein [Rhodospirillaceae bacterium]